MSVIKKASFNSTNTEWADGDTRELTETYGSWRRHMEADGDTRKLTETHGSWRWHTKADGDTRGLTEAGKNWLRHVRGYRDTWNLTKIHESWRRHIRSEGDIRELTKTHECNIDVLIIYPLIIRYNMLWYYPCMYPLWMLDAVAIMTLATSTK